MTDGRTLVGLFLCTDRDCNVILGSAQEFLKSSGRSCDPLMMMMLLRVETISPQPLAVIVDANGLFYQQ
jgi:small nuclear ribonucleoprotein (snRNP)-like protein